METAKKKNGVVFVLLSALCFSIGGLFLKMVPWSPLAINGGRALISTIIIAAVMAASHHKLIQMCIRDSPFPDGKGQRPAVI